MGKLTVKKDEIVELKHDKTGRISIGEVVVEEGATVINDMRKAPFGSGIGVLTVHAGAKVINKF